MLFSGCQHDKTLDRHVVYHGHHSATIYAYPISSGLNVQDQVCSVPKLGPSWLLIPARPYCSQISLVYVKLNIE